MTSYPALLPSGLADVLPPDAAAETAAGERALAVMRANGYEQTSPPMLEFEDSFLAGAGAPLARETFRMMDPESQRMLALRSDMTPQIARIATTRLANAPRPLRLCYLGSVMRVSGGRPAGERQLRQAGAELIGSRRAEADAEIVLLAASALAAIGIARPSVDLNAPRMAGAIAAAEGLEGERLDALFAALDRKDAAETRRLAPPRVADQLVALIEIGGPADTAFTEAAKIDLPEPARARIQRLAGIVALIQAEAPDLALTLDFVEYRGVNYHTGVAFSLFAEGVSVELGRGGRYRAPPPAGGGQDGEPAVGFSLFMDAAGRAAARPAAPARVFMPHAAGGAARKAAQAAGFIAVAGLEPVADAAAEARRLGCRALWRDGGVVHLQEG